MKGSFHLPVIALLAISAAPVQADVVSRDWKTPGDGLLTYDDINQREWLDLTGTQLFKFPVTTLREQYQAVLAEIEPGGTFEEFIVASAVDVFGLADSAGIDTSTLDFSVNGIAAYELISLLGNPIPGAAPPNQWATGFLENSLLPTSLGIEYVPSGRSESTAGISFTNLWNSSNGVWLYRTVPEPNVSILVAFLIMARGGLR